MAADLTDSITCPACQGHVPAASAFCGLCGTPMEGVTTDRMTLYRAVTKYWPRIAGGIVLLAALIEFASGQLTPGWSLEFYIFGWASVTGGLWFLFDRAETVLSATARGKLVQQLTQRDFNAAFRSLPEQFALLFDRVFGERHFTWRCFSISATVSFGIGIVLYGLLLAVPVPGVSVSEVAPLSADPRAVPLLVSLAVGFALILALRTLSKMPLLVAAVAGFLILLLGLVLVVHLFDVTGMEGIFGGVIVVSLFFALANVVPDFLSLLETRLVLGLMQDAKKFVGGLVADAYFTATIWTVSTALVVTALAVGFGGGFSFEPLVTALWPPAYVLWFVSDTTGFGPGDSLPTRAFVVVSLLTTFFTSAWLWVYVLATLLARLLVRLSGGVGLLLRLTDLERQPFRSIGFVSVVVTSVVFLLGLPLVLM